MPCKTAPCSFDGIYQPPLRGPFIAFSAFVYMTEFFNLPPSSTLIDISVAGNTFCSLNWTELQQEYGSNPSWDYVTTYCFLNVYAVALLHHGYGLPLHSHEVTYLDSIGEVELSWTLGAMLSAADLLPWWVNPPAGSPSRSPSSSSSSSSTASSSARSGRRMPVDSWVV